MELKKDFPTSFLVPAEYNPRVMEEHKHEQLDEVLDYFGLVDPIIFNTKTGVIIGGNQRYEHIKKKEKGFALLLGDIGWYFTQEELKLESEADEKSLNLALNKISGRFDNELLKPLVEEIIETDAPISYFEDEELSSLLNIDFEEIELEEETTITEGNELYQEKKEQHKNQTYYLKEGDEWRIGTHTLKVGPVNPDQEKINLTIKGEDLRITLSSTENVEDELLLFKSHNKEIISNNKYDYNTQEN